MDKERLFQFMRVRFHEAGFTPEEINIHITRFRDRYASKNDEEIEADLRAHGGVAKIVSHIIDYRNSTLMQDPEYRTFVERGRKEPEKEAGSAGTEEQSVPEEAPAEEPFADERTEPQAEEVPGENADTAEAGSNENDDDDDDDDDVKPYIPGKAAYTQAAEETPSETVSDTAPAEKEQETEQKTEQKTEEGQTAAQSPVDEWLSVFDSIQTPQKKTARRTLPTEEDSGIDANLLSALNAHAPSARPAEEAHPVQQEAALSPDPEADLSSTKIIPAAQKTVTNSSSTPKEEENPEKDPAKRGSKRRLSLADRTYWGEGTEEGYRRFWILFAVCLPFAIILGLALLALCAGVIALLAAGIAALVLALVAEVGVGACIALIGIIYGISQLFITMPIGLFEVGIGVTVVGVTIFVGILIYNLAVRFLPFVLRQFIRFMKFMREYIKDLYYYLKGECYRR